MMNRIGSLLAGALIALSGAGPAAAQSTGRVTLDASPYAAVPTGAVAERWGLAFGFGANAAFDLVPNYALYGGYSRVIFDIDPFDELRAVDSGYSAGLTRRFPTASLGVLPWVATGLVLHDLEIRDGTATGGGSRPGFEVRSGLLSGPRFIPHLRGTVELGYRQYGARVLGPERETVSYFIGGIGFSANF
jgi:hypothetical protein